MREMRYDGPTVESLGRFGRVRAGDTLQLTEAEYKGVADSPHWRQVNVAEFEAERSGAIPQPTRYWDLRAIHWDSPRLSRVMAAKGKPTLRKIARAMLSVGVRGVLCDRAFRAKEIADSICAAAAVEGWTEMTRARREELYAELAEREREFATA